MTAHVIAYSCCADVHCPACTKRAAKRMAIDHAHPHGLGTHWLDEHGLEFDTVDREGNLLMPVFDISEHNFTHCGDCHEEL